MSRECDRELERIYTATLEVVQSLETLQRPVQHWDDVLIFMTVKKLDSESVKAWEQMQGSSKEPPTWNRFREFLMTRKLSLQAYEHSQTNSSSTAQSRQSARSHISTCDNNDRSHSRSVCVLCSENHYIAHCLQYKQKNVKERIDFIKNNSLCFNCLGRHRLANCLSSKRCMICGKHHHTTLHLTEINIDNKGTHRVQLSATISEPEAESRNVHHAHKNSDVTTMILLATTQVEVVNNHHEVIKVRAVLDQGSEVSLVTENLVQRLHLPRKSSAISLLGIGAQSSSKSHGIASLTLRPHFNTGTSMNVDTHILPRLTSMIPAVHIPSAEWSHLEGLSLADPRFTEPGQIDIIIGADVYGQLLLEGPIKKGPADTPIAQPTKLGWILSGPCGPAPTNSVNHSYRCSIDQGLDMLLERFWLQEEIRPTINKSLSLLEKQCEDHFVATHTRESSGRYVIRLPFKNSSERLGDSKPVALQMLLGLQRKFVANSTYHQAYSSFLREYETLQHMVEINDEESDQPQTYYLSHHGVLRESSTTTKLRVVSNGTRQIPRGLPLNSILHTCAKLQVDLFDVLIWSRQHRYIFSSDMEKMYRQIEVHPEDCKYQRILWLKSQNIVTYQLSTVTYGLACAPFLALRTILQLIHEDGDDFPLAVEVLKKGRYVDDVFGGADTIDEAKQVAHQVNQLCMAGGFPLKE